MDDETELTAWQEIGAIVRRPAEQAMVSSTPCTKRPDIRLPTTDGEYRALRHWAETTPTDRTPVATGQEITRHISFMAATLPSRAIDDLSGKMRVAVYQSLLAGYSNDALAYMARRVCETLHWFPTPRQCLDVLAEYRSPETDQSIALRLCHTYAQQTFDTWLVNVKSGQPVGDVPDQWKRIAVEQGVMRRLQDGSYVSRVLYHGPFKPFSPPLSPPLDPIDAA